MYSSSLPYSLRVPNNPSSLITSFWYLVKGITDKINHCTHFSSASPHFIPLQAKDTPQRSVFNDPYFIFFFNEKIPRHETLE
jgi:hypothetical protein